ncbi:hypothetical protein CsSME_00002001 [Camellia sinensis var. sinensis]
MVAHQIRTFLVHLMLVAASRYIALEGLRRLRSSMSIGRVLIGSLWTTLHTTVLEIHMAIFMVLLVIISSGSVYFVMLRVKLPWCFHWEGSLMERNVCSLLTIGMQALCQYFWLPSIAHMEFIRMLGASL